jgi:RNA polymerase sigma-70 factor (ECF subfamily)
MAEDQREADSDCPASIDLQQLADTHGDHLVRSAFLLCGDQTEAQDLAQETLLQALKSAHRFRGGSTVFTWLYGILRNLCHRHLRKQKRLVLREELLLHEAAPPNTDSGTDQEYCAARLAQALQELSPEHREAILLRYYEGLKIDEIAAHTGVSQGTVKSRLHYASRRLQELLPEEMNLFVSADTHHQATP